MHTPYFLAITVYGLIFISSTQAFIQDLSCYQERSLYKTLVVMQTTQKREKQPNDLFTHVLKQACELLKNISRESVYLLHHNNISSAEIKKIHTIITCCDVPPQRFTISTLRNVRNLFENMVITTPTTLLEQYLQRLRHLMVEMILVEKNICLFISSFQEAHRPRYFIRKASLFLLFASAFYGGYTLFSNYNAPQHNHTQTVEHPSSALPAEQASLPVVKEILPQEPQAFDVGLSETTVPPISTGSCDTSVKAPVDQIHTCTKLPLQTEPAISLHASPQQLEPLRAEETSEVSNLKPNLPQPEPLALISDVAKPLQEEELDQREDQEPKTTISEKLKEGPEVTKEEVTKENVTFPIKDTIPQPLLHKAPPVEPLEEHFLPQPLIRGDTDSNQSSPSKATDLTEGPEGQKTIVAKSKYITKPGYSAVKKAIDNNQLDVLKLLIEGDNKLLKKRDHDGITPFLYAAKKGNIDACKLLVKQGANVTLQDHTGKTALHLAAEHDHVHAVACYCKQNTLICIQDKDGNTPLHLAALHGHTGSVSTLLTSAPSCIHQKNSLGATPLHLAVIHGHAEIVSLLLTHRACKTIEDNSGKTPGDYALQGGHKRILWMLNNSSRATIEIAYKTNFYQEADDAWLALHYVAKNGDLEMVKRILTADRSSLDKQTSQCGWTALHIAAMYNHPSLVQYLLDQGALPTVLSSKKLNILHAASGGKGGKEMIKLLLLWGMNIETSGWTALHFAAQHGNLDACKALVENGAHLNLRDSPLGWTPLNCALKHHHLEVAKFLIERGTDINQQDSRGSSSLHEAVDYDNFEMAKLLLERGAAIDCVIDGHWSPLHAAAHYGNKAIVSLLVSKGANTTIKYKDPFNNKFTAADLARAAGHKEIAKIIESK